MPQRQRSLVLDLFHDTLHQVDLPSPFFPTKATYPSLDHQICVPKTV